jgi:hypothetical protein
MVMVVVVVVVVVQGRVGGWQPQLSTLLMCCGRMLTQRSNDRSAAPVTCLLACCMQAASLPAWQLLAPRAGTCWPAAPLP